MFNSICFILPIFLFCMSHVTLSYFNLCVVPFIAFTFDNDIPLIELNCDVKLMKLRDKIKLLLRKYSIS